MGRFLPKEVEFVALGWVFALKIGIEILYRNFSKLRYLSINLNLDSDTFPLSNRFQYQFQHFFG